MTDSSERSQEQFDGTCRYAIAHWLHVGLGVLWCIVALVAIFALIATIRSPSAGGWLFVALWYALASMYLWIGAATAFAVETRPEGIRLVFPGGRSTRVAWDSLLSVRQASGNIPRLRWRSDDGRLYSWRLERETQLKIELQRFASQLRSLDL